MNANKTGQDWLVSEYFIETESLCYYKEIWYLLNESLLRCNERAWWNILHKQSSMDVEKDVSEEGVFRVTGAHRCLDTAHTQFWWKEVKLCHSPIGIPIWYVCKITTML